MTITSFKVPSKFVSLMDQLIQKGLYTSRGDLIRDAIQEYRNMYDDLNGKKGENTFNLPSKSILDFFI